MSGQGHQIRAFFIIIAILAVILWGLTSCLTTPASAPAPATPPASIPEPASMPEQTSSPEPVPSSTPKPVPTPRPAQPAPSLAPVPALARTPEEILPAHFGFLGASFDAMELAELGITWDRPHPGPFIWGRIEREKGK